ncbi:hypothetical protein GBA65_08760 [Rubrobacter marinus]|uniref:Diterpene synthase n=1 Tax=Rubrobacter marinus TaxID=2653852 RepID=A0A6G8PWS6_9ACTN|nr:hypothetical protein [Rubrobacter marinus]QIN78597.1 hypothetical protein GBA65_08760 [Rubrobacter marinus]
MNTETSYSSPSISEWMDWPPERVAEAVKGFPSPLVVGWPYNGTRRWYLSRKRRDSGASDYLTVLIRRQAELHRMMFDHGASVVLTPEFGSVTLRRGVEYTRYAMSGLLKLAEDPVCRELFDSGVRLRFYGEYREALVDPVFRPMLEACAELEEETASGDGPLLLLGLFADAPWEKIARLSVEFAATHGRPPDRRELIEGYYGAAVPDLSFYIGHTQPEMFDVPLLAGGEEHLYATLNPSPDLSERQFREILYDHLFSRRVPLVDYEALPPEAQGELIEYNERCSGATVGLGRVHPVTRMWRPVFPDVPAPPQAYGRGGR